MNPVDGQLLAKLPDLGLKEKGQVSDGLLSRDPHLGVVHLGVHRLHLVQLQGSTHEAEWMENRDGVGARRSVQTPGALSYTCTRLPREGSSSTLIVLSLSTDRAATSFLLPPIITTPSFLSRSLSVSLSLPFSPSGVLLYIIGIHRQ